MEFLTQNTRNFAENAEFRVFRVYIPISNRDKALGRVDTNFAYFRKLLEVPMTKTMRSSNYVSIVNHL